MHLFFGSFLLGYFLGCAFGIGCALAVMYSIFLSGYRAAVLDHLKGANSRRFQNATAWANKKLAGKLTDRPW